MNSNTKQYIESLESIKPDEKLVNETIQKIREMKMQKLEQETTRKTTSFNKIRFIKYLSMGVAATFVIVIASSQLSNLKNKNNSEPQTLANLNIVKELGAKEIKNKTKNEVLDEIFYKYNSNNFQNISVTGENYTRHGTSNSFALANEVKNNLYKINGDIYLLDNNSDATVEEKLKTLDMHTIYDIRSIDRCSISIPSNVNGVLILQFCYYDDPNREFDFEYMITLTADDNATLQNLLNIETKIFEDATKIQETAQENNNTQINILDKKIAEEGKIVDGQKITERRNKTSEAELILSSKGEKAYKLCIKLETEKFAERNVDVSKVNSDTTYEINTRVIDYFTVFNVKTQCTWIAYLLDNGTVEYLILEENIQKGDFKNNYKLTELNNIVDLEDENTGVFAVKSDGTKIELKNKINEIVNQKNYNFSKVVYAESKSNNEDTSKTVQTVGEEEPIKNMCEGMQNANLKTFLKSYPKFMKMNEYITQEDLNINLGEYQEKYGMNLKISYEIQKKEKISAEDLTKVKELIKKYYSEDVNIVAGYKITSVTTIKGEKDSESSVDTMKVYQIDGTWYLIGL